MSTTTLSAFLARCRVLYRPRSNDSDAELLRRFSHQRDSAAFEELLERHASLVWGVCRRILPCESDCEDAFQATFLALVHRPHAVDPSRSLAAWLHTVAVRVAYKTRRRSARERPQSVLPERATSGDVSDDVGNRELFRMVDEEIERLPSAVRTPLILCCLHGRTRDEAAEALGCSVAAIKGRLERGRELLSRRLERRGVQLPLAFLVMGITGDAVRATLRVKTIQAILSGASPALIALIPAAGVSLMSKLTLTAMSLVMVGVLSFGAYRAAQTETPQEAPALESKALPKSLPTPAVEKAQPLLDRFGDSLPEGAIRRFGTLRFRHFGIDELAFTPDSKQLIAGSGCTPLTVFDAVTGRPLRQVGKTSANNPYGFALSSDGKRVACCGFDVFVWDLETGKLIRELGCGRCQAVAFSSDGKKIAVVKEFQGTVVLVEAATGKQLGEWTPKNEQPSRYHFNSLAFSPDGKFLAVLLGKYISFPSVSSQVCLLDAEKGTLVRTFGSADDPFLAFAFQPGTGRLAGVGKNGVLRFRDVETGKELHHLPATKGVSHIPQFTADGRRCLALHKNGFLTVLDAKDGRELHRIEIGTRIQPSVFAFSPDGRTVAETKQFFGTRVRVWDIESGAERLADAGHNGPALLSWSADGRTLLSRVEGRQMFRGDDGEMFHWDLRTGAGHRKPFAVEDEVGRSSWTGGTTTVRGRNWQLAIDYEKMELEVRSLDGSSLLRKANMPTTTRAIALSADGTHVAVAFQDAGNTVFLWNPEKEEKPRHLLGHPDACQRLLFSHDGKRLIAGAGTHNAYPSSTLWVWDVATARVVRKLATNSAPAHMLLTADDRVLLTGGLYKDGTVHVWDMETGKELALLTDPPNKEPEGPVGGLALSADERFLAVIFNRGDASRVSVWETGSWKAVHTFAPTRSQNYTKSMIFSRDGRSLFVANSDSTILEWDVSGRAASGRRQPVGKSLNRDRLNVLWQTLADTADKAYPAVWELLDHPSASVPFLVGKLAPVPPVDEKRVRKLLAQLDSESFAEREEASRQLLALGDGIVPLLRRTLTERPSLEMKKRIEGAIESLTRGPSPEQLRLLRALAVLEWSDATAALEHLRRLAGGAGGASTTEAAKAALRRMPGETAPKPR